ncbi:MAG: Crp/Fnr family transcriptional regulator [Acidobacteriia bacterium]|nr:Crp/Fnr family transcriptional regulator [Terriglobia bacterium]
MPSPYGLKLVESCVTCKLRNHTFFCSLPRSSLVHLDTLSLANLLPKGSILFVAGQKPGGVHILCAGKVKVCTQRGNGKLAMVKIAGPGEVLGLHACIGGTVHEFTAETVEPSHIVFVRGDDFKQFLSQNEVACWKAAQILSRDCHEAYEIIRSGGGARSGSAKLARLLLDIAVIGKPHGDEIEVVLPLTHKEMAQAIGMSRETVWRKLVEFRHRGIAILKGSVLLIHNKAELQRLAGR